MVAKRQLIASVTSHLHPHLVGLYVGTATVIPRDRGRRRAGAVEATPAGVEFVVKRAAVAAQDHHAPEVFLLGAASSRCWSSVISCL